MELPLDKLSVKIKDLRVQSTVAKRLEVVSRQLGLGLHHIIRAALAAGVDEVERQAREQLKKEQAMS